MTPQQEKDQDMFNKRYDELFEDLEKRLEGSNFTFISEEDWILDQIKTIAEKQLIEENGE